MSGDARTLRELLHEGGVTDDAIGKAIDDGTLELLALEHLVAGSPPRYDVDELASRAGMPVEQIASLWRALGFADPQPHEKAFSDDDLAMLQTLGTLIQTGVIDPDLVMQMTRVIGSSVARIALAQVEAFSSDDEDAATDGSDQDAAGLGGDTGGSGDTRDADDADVHDDASADVVPRAGLRGISADLRGISTHDELDDREFVDRTRLALDVVPMSMDYVWRRHVAAAVRNRLLRVGSDDPVGSAQAIGFADLVGFTLLSQQISAHELAGVVNRFETLAHDTVARLGGRVIKMIGDEVMFAVDDGAQAVEIALTLAEIYRDDDELSDVRVGLAYGPVLEREGDCYGPVVNLASRIVGIAFPGTVVVSEGLHAALEADDRLAWRYLHRRQLKDIGRVPLWTVRRSSDPFGPRSNREQARADRTERIEEAVERRVDERRSGARRPRRRPATADDA